MMLYVKGDIKAFQNPTIALIGTREPSILGQKLGKNLADIFVNQNITLVSGLALGCDTIAHQSCVNHQKPTIAIMAGGLDKIYPKENEKLANQIIENGGLLVSEFPCGEKPTTYTFVQRDRLQSGLSYATCIIQTGLKGGTLSTAKYATSQNRILACIFPTNPIQQNEIKFQGNKLLINQGALKLSSKETIDNLIMDVKKQHQKGYIQEEKQLTLF